VNVHQEHGAHVEADSKKRTLEERALLDGETR
jgi:hypothetical protein